MIAQLEERLASHVGPVATILLRRATARSSDFNALRERLAAHFPTDAARRDFNSLLMRLETPGEGSRVMSSMKRTSMPKSESVNYASIKPDVLQDATLKLAAYVGPIARVIVARAAANVPDIDTFYDRLIAAVQDQKDSDALRRDLGSAPD